MITDEDREWARQVAARLRPLSSQKLDELAMLLRPAVLAARQARAQQRPGPRPPRRAPGGGSATT
jgi:hypothetical protein